MQIALKRSQRMMIRLSLAIGFVVLAVALDTTGQRRTNFPSVAERYDVLSNQVYRTVDGWEGKLDLYLPSNGKNNALVVFIHGGGWTQGSKEAEVLYALPYLEEGWAVANVEYRLAKIAKAPAAVIDCKCALAWIGKNASKLNIDPEKIVVAGISAGGHLALAIAMIGDLTSEGSDCFRSAPRAAAVINLFGPSDIVDLISGPNRFSQAVEWLSDVDDVTEVAKMISPINHLSKASTPVITLHGVKDDLIPFSQSVRLHDRLTKLGVRNRLLTLRSRGHGGFTSAEWTSAYRRIFAFVRKELFGREGGTRTR